MRGRDNLEEPGEDGRIILRWVFRKWDVVYGLDRSGSGQGQVAGTYNCDYETSVSIKYREFIL